MTMVEIFVDTFFWVAMLNPKDAAHQWAMGTPKPQRAVTTNAVLLEVMNTYHAVRWRKIAVDFWRTVNNDADTIVLQLEKDLLDRGVELMEKRPDKEWSLTDCVSF